MIGSLYSFSDHVVTPKQAYMSSVWWYISADEGGPELCIDKDPGSICHSLTTSESHPWLAIELHTETMVRRVVITNRRDCCGDRMRKVKVFVSQALPEYSDRYMRSSEAILFGIFEGPGTDGQIVKLDGSARGNFVVIQMKTETLNLAEIEIFDHV